MAKMTIQQPQSQAGILGVSSGTNMGGIKMNPRVFAICAIFLVLTIKILDKIVAG